MADPATNHDPPTSDANDDSKSRPSTSQSTRQPPSLRRRVSVTDLLNPNNPWVLEENGGFLTMFDAIPEHLRKGPWSLTATLALFIIVYLLAVVLIAANLKYAPAQGLLHDFYLSPDAYQAYTVGWYYNAATFLWMTFVAWLVWTESSLSTVAWVSFTLWSWTTITLRHGLCALAPFVPSVRIVCELLRFPVLLSASVTFGVWNLVLMPLISLVLIKDATKRINFLRYMTSFRLTQLHVFNLVFAVLNGYYVHPRRPLHLGDLNVIVVFMASYVIWYYFVLDRIGIHLYPIFSPRAPWVIGSWGLIVAICMGGYQFWKALLAVQA